MDEVNSTHPMRVVEHRSDSVEAETVELINVQPPAQIRQQEPEHFDSGEKDNPSVRGSE